MALLLNKSVMATRLIKTCYVGTPGNDMVYGVQTDKYGYPYIMGTTTQSFPVYKSAFNTISGQVNGKQFITNLNPDLTTGGIFSKFRKGEACLIYRPLLFWLMFAAMYMFQDGAVKQIFEYYHSSKYDRV